MYENPDSATNVSQCRNQLSEVRLDPISLAFIAQVDYMFIFSIIFSIFLPLFLFFHPWAVKGVEGGNNIGGGMIQPVSKSGRTSSQNMTFVGQNAPLIHLSKKVLFCRVAKSNHTVLPVNSIRLIQELCESFLTDPFFSSLFIFQICCKKIQAWNLLRFVE